MKKLIVLMLTFILFFTVFNITPQLKIQIAKAVTINVYPGDSIQDAINSASPGDIIFVFNGIYEEIINIDVEGLTLEGEDKENTIIIDAYYLGDAVEVLASNVKIKNFTIKNAKDHGVIAENINNMTIENCIIENNGAYGVYLLASSNTISNCEIFENYYSGIKIGGSSYAEANNNAVINCEFYDNGYGGMQDNIRAAISISAINGIVTNTKIADCLFYCSYGYDVYVEGNTVENNIFYHNNFLSKTVLENVYDSGINNIWYNQTLEEGNFWIDYTEKYPDATSSNGVWNIPYEISGKNNKDLYPLVDPIGLDRPVADANGPYTADKGVAIAFNASDSYDPDGTYLFYDWDLGNGETKYGKTVSYIYSYPGTYNITLTIEDYHGLTDSDSTTAVITGSSNTPPDVPSAPIPSNGSVGVDLNTDISWSCSDPDGDALTYDVYFGTTNNPSKISSNQSGTTYDLGIMNFNTKYYWKIVAWDNHGASTTGSLWDYTTKVNNPPNPPFNPDPSNHNPSVDINADLSWLGGDPDSGDTVKYDVYFGTTNNPSKVKSNQSGTTYYPGKMNFNTKYYWKIVAWDNHGASTTGPLWDFTTTVYVNYPPNTPFNPTPNNKTNIDINQNLYWNGGDLNSNDTVTYDIYFGTSNPPEFKETIGPYNASQTLISYDPDTMNFNTKYYWKIIAEDNHGNSSAGPIWSFTTEKQSSGGGNGGGGGSFLPPNLVPIANASASDNSGFVNKSITFDGSYSVDEDGEITDYTWDFGDGNFGYGIITTHIYKKTGTYTVKLTVTDDNDVSDTDSFRVIISQPNNLPNAPQIEGPKTGKQDIEYNFTVFSTDPDNDNIQYVFNWGDDQANETDFVASGTIYTEKHRWASPGIFKIRVYAVDTNYAVSASAETNILIDVIYCKNIGYFIDEDSNGIYDLFYSNQTGIKTVTERQGDGSYLVNNDLDSDWDYIYNTQTGALSAYSSETIPGDTKVDNTIFYALAIVLIIVILLLFAILGKKPKEEKKIEKEEEEKQDKAKQKTKKETTKKKQTKKQKKKSTTKKKGKKRK